MYFTSRLQAGQKLASSLADYKTQPCLVVALSLGAVPVAEPIAHKLGCHMALLLTEDITLPGERMALGTVNQDGGFVYNNDFTHGDSTEYYAEFHNYIDDQKRQKFGEINRLLGPDGALEPAALHGRVVILVADGLGGGTPLDAAVLFLKPIKTKRVVVAAPIASVTAVDRMHIVADDIRCLSVTDNFISASHYYDTNDSDQPTYLQTLERIKTTTQTLLGKDSSSQLPEFNKH